MVSRIFSLSLSLRVTHHIVTSSVLILSEFKPASLFFMLADFCGFFIVIATAHYYAG